MLMFFLHVFYDFLFFLNNEDKDKFEGESIKKQGHNVALVHATPCLKAPSPSTFNTFISITNITETFLYCLTAQFAATKAWFS